MSEKLSRAIDRVGDIQVDLVPVSTRRMVAGVSTSLVGDVMGMAEIATHQKPSLLAVGGVVLAVIGVVSSFPKVSIHRRSAQVAHRI